MNLVLPITIDIKDPDRLVDYTLSVAIHCDDAGQYMEPNEVCLECGVVWIEKHGFAFAPETNVQAKYAGSMLWAKFGEEIDAAVRREIERAKEFAD